MALDPVTAALDVGNKLIDKFWPDAGQAEKDKMSMFLSVFAAQADIVKTEAGTGGLASWWRPITMLTFTGLIVARWFGWAAPNLSPEEYLKLWDIVQLGLGGYVIGRSVEKIVPSIADAIKR
ncbi:Holin of 3TMs, for gene-transfer release [uncultured Caudovirales phage]|uniref:Holin of 3TMs, for gene-transfer release n=1 Tax=uncultured Caudovirales phage TaxID=2100421 RepID=A0A6J5LIP5_9CAUD|nr:Holin of 3TMs, for gene-transfer release [uncultured Caudovirales phage]CAB4132957.1 Holin of 3TMs, for gene-transfer release [uncultured Caudovirales phage]